MELDFCKVTAIIRPDCLEKVEEALRRLDVPGVSVTKVNGNGEHADLMDTVQCLTGPGPTGK